MRFTFLLCSVTIKKNNFVISDTTMVQQETKINVQKQYYIEMAKNINIYINKECVTVEHVLPAKNAMSPVEFDPGTSRIVSHHSTN